MKTSRTLRNLAALVLLVLLVGVPVYADAPSPDYPPVVMDIPPQEDALPVPKFIGDTAVPHEIVVPPDAIWANPFMAQGAFSVVHNDTYMSDTYPQAGPLGNDRENPDVKSVLLASLQDETDPRPVLPGTLVFDKMGRPLAAVQKPDAHSDYMRAWLTLFDPETLQPLAWLAMPQEPRPPQDGRILKLPAGAYFYLDGSDNLVIGAADRRVWVVSHTYEAPFSFNIERQYALKDPVDPSKDVIPEDDDFQAVQPDKYGYLWFASKGGIVGTLDMNTGEVLGYFKLAEDEIIENAMASDETGGVFMDSSKALYRLDADSTGKPGITWREPYDGGTHVKVLSRGSGTTPTLMGRDYVTFVDNADPQDHVLVYRRAKTIEGSRLVCAMPVFMPGQSNSENSLIATEKSIVVENNFGYRGIKSTLHGATSKPGITRIDLNADGKGCHVVWTNWEESVASAATQKLSLETGLIYAYTKSKGPVSTDAYYFTAVDFWTGKTVYKVLAGTGSLYNDHLSVLYVGPNERLYVGVLGGMVTYRDSKSQ
jgi:hypothetical protein